MRGDIVDAVAAQGRPSRNFQWVAAVAAVLLAILVVVGLMSTRFAPRASGPAATPKPTSPIGEYGAPPPGVNLLYARDPVHPTWLISYDWTGNPRGTIKLDPAIGGVGMAPDGQEFAVGIGAKGGTGELLDRLGHPIPGSGAIPGKAGPMWADDNRHMCGVSFDLQTFDWTFVTLAPGEAVKSVAVIARDPNIGQTGIRLAACSVRNDQAILVRTTIAWPSEIWVVRVSDGKVLSHTAYSNSSPTLSNVIASRDAVYIAEISTQATGQVGGGATSTVIRRVSDRSVVATLDPTMGVLAFGGNDLTVLVTTSPWIGQQPIHLAVVDWRSGKMLWRYDGPETLGSYLAEEGGNLDQAIGPGFAIGLKVISGTDDPQSDVVLVRGNGSETKLTGRYNLVW
jgi:hypothetical protein